MAGRFGMIAQDAGKQWGVYAVYALGTKRLHSKHYTQTEARAEAGRLKAKLNMTDMSVEVLPLEGGETTPRRGYYSGW